MNRTPVDFLVSAVDNYGDTGFALDLAEAVAEKLPGAAIRFFSDDRGLFDRLSKGKTHRSVGYRNLQEYESEVPASKIVSFFDRRFPSEHVAKFPYPKKIILLSYPRFDAGSEEAPGVGSMNGTRYRIEGDEFVHLVPSPLPEGAWVVVRDRGNPSRSVFPSLIPLRNQAATGVFCYPVTEPRIREIAKADPSLRFVGFWNDAFGETLPFLRFDEYAHALPSFTSNVVRGENSAVMALLSGKPFLWDFYKEPNGAHKEKIDDFLRFLKPHFDDREAFDEYAIALRSFNSKYPTELDPPLWAKTLAGRNGAIRSAFEKAASECAKRDLVTTVLEEFSR